MLSRDRILDLLAELDHELAQRDERGEIMVTGGEAMVLAFKARPATRDIDAIWEPASAVREAAAAVVRRHAELDDDWLNDGMKGFLPGQDPGEQQVVYDGDHLSVAVASPEYLLAMKLLASRRQDVDDLRLLLHHCGIAEPDAALDLVERFYPGRPIEARVRFTVEDLFSS